VNGSDNDAFSTEEALRYIRQMGMPEVGREGQLRLREAKVLIVGAGGLGSPAALYLAGAGVGLLGIVDPEKVELSNLHRQILYDSTELGRRKVDSAREALADLNPYVEVRTHPVALTSGNAMEILRDYDVIVDGSDNFPTRYLVNDACVLLGKPSVYGSVLRFDGQVAVFDARRGPCYRCLFPEPPEPGEVPSCAEAGVLGALPGIVGAMQAAEVVKLILGTGEPLIGRLLLVDALGARFREVRVHKNPACAVCGGKPTVTELIDYESFCGSRTGTRRGVPSISPAELAELRSRGGRLVVVDVRERDELAISRLDGAVHIPMYEIARRLGELDPAADIVVICRAGERSGPVTRLLLANGFPRVRGLMGGLNAYSRDIDSSIPVY
jgi:molybdopterin/thiamine biosynthesis adenylyltransferase/rhodanese-related sulfurtransferase